MELKTGDSAAGSLWNKNSWHWEEKDYHKLAQAKLSELLSSVEVVPNVFVGKEIDLKGFASISVRKGKKVVVFEYAISLPIPGGYIKIPEFSNDELDPVFRVECSDEEVKAKVRQNVSKAIKPRLAEFVEFINSVESQEEILLRDKARREAELALTNKAAQETGSLKEEIGSQIRAIDEAKFKQRIETDSSRAEATGSVWNVNSYHWETRKFEKWAFDWIKQRLESDPRFTSLVVEGECETSIRKGKKLCLYNLMIQGRFEETPFSVPCFSNEGEDIRVICESEKRRELEKVLEDLVFSTFLDSLKAQ